MVNLSPIAQRNKYGKIKYMLKRSLELCSHRCTISTIKIILFF